MQTAARQGDAPVARDQRMEPDDGFATTDAWLAAFIASRTGRAWAEPGLSTRECAYLALAADVAQQTLRPGFQAHVARARASGATPELRSSRSMRLSGVLPCEAEATLPPRTSAGPR